MRPRIVRPATARARAGVTGIAPGIGSTDPFVLRSVEPRRAPESAELWIGIHVTAFNAGASLERLATTAQRFTPRVSLVPPDGLLIEVRGSLHLFGGVDGLMQALTRECATVGITSVLAMAPTPLAALVAARVGDDFVVTNKAHLIGKLSTLSLTLLRWEADVIERLARMGVRTIGQVLRLPRAGFARRFGPIVLAELDRLTGRNADLRAHFQPRERFRRRRELTCELENNATLLSVLAPLMRDLGRFLRERQAGVTELEVRLRHRHAPASSCVLRLASPVADVVRLTELLGERLNAFVLPEPVRSCELISGLPARRVLVSNPLWQAGEYGSNGSAESPELIERLRARLGHEAVYGLKVLEGHRPESAWCQTEPGQRRHQSAAANLPWSAFRRPLWLLHTPQHLDEVDGVPRRRGALRFFGDIERVETGWWDGGDVGRDYYTVFDIYGIQLWIFRERAEPHRWYLHGVFG